MVGRLVEQQHVGPATSACASATRFFVPPDSSPIVRAPSRCSAPASSRRAAPSSRRRAPRCASAARRGRRRRRAPRSASRTSRASATPSLTASNTVAPRRRTPAPAARSRCAGPASAAAGRRRASPGRQIFSSDDLPAPLRPIRPTRSPASSEKLGVVEQGDVAEGEVGVGEGEEGHGEERRRQRAERRRRGAGERALERVEEHRGDVEAGLLGDLLEAGRAGDVDLGQAVADHVQADQQQAARRQHRAERLGDLAVARARAAAPRPCRRPPGCRGSRCPAGCAPARTAPARRR